MNLSTKSIENNSKEVDDVAAPLNLCVKKSISPKSEANAKDDEVWVGEERSEDGHQSESWWPLAQQKRRARRRKSSRQSPLAVTDQSNQSERNETEGRRRKRGRPPTLSPPPPLPNSTHPNSDSAFPLDLLNTPDILSTLQGINALTAAASANPLINSQNPIIELLRKLNANDVTLEILSDIQDQLNTLTPENEPTPNKTNDVSVNGDVTTKKSRTQPAPKPAPSSKLLYIPLDHGWKRITHITGISEPSTILGDVCYIAPDEKKIKSYADLLKYLAKNDAAGMTREHFSFDSSILVGMFVLNLKDTESEVILTESEMAAQLEEMGMNLPTSSNDVQANYVLGKRKKRVRESDNNRKIYDSTKEFNGFSTMSDDEEKPLVTITIKNVPSAQIESNAKQRKPIATNQVKNDSRRDSKRNAVKYNDEQEEPKMTEDFKRQLEQLEELQLLATIEEERAIQHQAITQFFSEIQLQDDDDDDEDESDQEDKEQNEETEDKNKPNELEEEMEALEDRNQVKKLLEMELMQELKRPVEDMMLKDHKPIPVFERIPGLKLTGKAFADTLMVYEFLYNFSETIGFDKDSLPDLNSLIMALLNLDSEAEDELMSIVTHLVICAIEDPAMPNPVSTATGQKLKDATVTEHNVSEILRLYFQSFYNLACEDGRNERVECQIYQKLCCGVSFIALDVTTKLDILTFLCNELLCNQAIVKQIDDSIESVTAFKRDRWIIENEIRKLRIVKFKREKATELENAKLLARSESMEDATIDNEIVDANLVSSVQECVDDLSLTNEEIDKKLDKLNKQCNQIANKMNKAYNAYRVFPLGQDRYRRTYWVLPNCGGVFVEAMESGDSAELVNNRWTEEELENESEIDAELNLLDRGQFKDILGDDYLEQDENDSVTSPLPLDNSLLERTDDLQINYIANDDENDEDDDDDNYSMTTSNNIDKTEDQEQQGTITQMSIDDQFVIDYFDENEEENQEFVNYDEELQKIEENLDEEELADLDDQFAVSDEEELEERETECENNQESETSEQSVVESKNKTQNDGEEDDELDDILWFDLEEDCDCERDESDQEEDIQSEIDNSEEEQRELERGLRTFFDEQTCSSIFDNAEKNPDNALIKESLLRIVEPFIKSALVTEFPNCNVSPIDITICSTLQKRIQIWRILQYPVVRKVPREYQLGWWRITDPSQVKALTEILHISALRERNLQRYLVKFLNVSMLSCKNNKVNFEVNDFDRDALETHQFGAPTKNLWCHNKCFYQGYCEEVSIRKNQQVMELIEGLEEKILSCSMQSKNWKPTSQTSNSNCNATSLNENDSTDSNTMTKLCNGLDVEMTNQNGGIDEKNWSGLDMDTLLSLQRQKLLRIESGIERKYLKPPLNFKNNQMIVANSNCEGDNETECNDSLADDALPTGLLRWRDAVWNSNCSSQIAVCLHFLESCIAWEKSVMRASCQFCGSGEDEAQLLLCDLCDKGYHMHCFKPKMEMVPSGDWFCYDCQNKNTIDKVCIVCGKKGKLLNCDTCAKTFHPNCLDPPMTKQLKGRWICHLCLRKNKRNSKSSKKTSHHNEKNCSEMVPKENKRVSNGNTKEKVESDKEPKKDKKTKKNEDKNKVKKEVVETKSESDNHNEMEQCKQILYVMECHDNSWPFLTPVNTKQFPTYKKIIKKPIDMATIRSKLDAHSYKNKEDFAADLRLMFDNCFVFNEDESPVGHAGHCLRALFESKWKEMFNVS